MIDPRSVPPWLLLLSTATTSPCATPPLRLDWARHASAKGCPSGQRVAELVTSRLGCSPFATEPDTRFEVIVQHSMHSWTATVTRYDANDALRSQHALTSEHDDCAVLGDAVALTLALMVEAMPTSQTATTAPPPAPPPVGQPPPRLVWVPTSTRTAPPSLAPQDRGHVEASVVLNLGTFPGVSWGASMAARWRATDHLELGLGLTAHPNRRWGDVGFGLLAGAVGACLRFRAGPRASLAGCGRVYIGSITALVHAGAEPVQPGVFWWAATSVGVRARLRVKGPVFMHVGVEALITLVNRVFVTSPNRVEAFNEAPLAWVGAFGVGAEFH